jgi:hypothetical protein
VGFGRSGGGQRDDEELLVAQGRDEGEFVGVVDVRDANALREGVRAVGAGERRYGVSAGVEEGAGEVAA